MPTRTTRSLGLSILPPCASEQRQLSSEVHVCGAVCAAAHCVPKKTMVNNEVKTMGAKRKRGRAGKRVTHVTGFHPHISPHYMFDIHVYICDIYSLNRIILSLSVLSPIEPCNFPIQFESESLSGHLRHTHTHGSTPPSTARLTHGYALHLRCTPRVALALVLCQVHCACTCSACCASAFIASRPCDPRPADPQTPLHTSPNISPFTLLCSSSCKVMLRRRWGPLRPPLFPPPHSCPQGPPCTPP